MLPIIEDKKSRSKLWVDIRELSIKYVISVEKVKRFFEELANGKLYATKCRNCESIYFPPQISCPICRTDDVEWIELSGDGVLLTYTKIYVKPKSFSHYDNYIVAVGRLKDGVNVTAWLRADLDKVRVGAKVKLRVVKREPEGYLTYEWVLDQSG